MLVAGSENPSALAANLGNCGNLFNTPSDGYVATEFASFSSRSFTFDKSASVYVTPWRQPRSGSYAVSPPAYSRFAVCINGPVEPIEKLIQPDKSDVVLSRGAW
jgi:hypothetical protein